jgi:hypothetical protein
MKVSATKYFRLMLYRVIIAVFVSFRTHKHLVKGVNRMNHVVTAVHYGVNTSIIELLLNYTLVRTNIDTLLQTLCVSCGNCACAVCSL